jgi:hypothetical protein
MIDQEARSERIAIRMDSHMTESEAIRMTDAELKPKPINVLQHRVEELASRQHQDKLDRKLKHIAPVVPYVERGEK